MNLSVQTAKQLKDVHFGGNWTCTNLKDVLSDVTREEALTKIHDFNTIAVLTFHVHYFVAAVLKVLEGGPLDSKDEYSFTHPPIQSEADWQELKQKVFDDATRFSTLIETLPEAQLSQDFIDPKYGTYFRNFIGISEHTHYHLGQITLIKKLIRLKDV